MGVYVCVCVYIYIYIYIYIMFAKLGLIYVYIYIYTCVSPSFANIISSFPRSFSDKSCIFCKYSHQQHGKLCRNEQRDAVEFRRREIITDWKKKRVKRTCARFTFCRVFVTRKV